MLQYRILADVPISADGGEHMKRNIIAIGLVFAMLASFASCKKLPQDSEFVVESQVYVVDDAGVTHNVQSEYDESGKQIYYYEDISGNKVIVNDKDVVVESTKVRKTTTAVAGGELTPEEQSFLDVYNDPDAFNNLVDESLTEPELEIEEVIPEENFEKIEVEVDGDGNPKHDDIEQRYTDIINGGKFTMDMTLKTKTESEEMVIPMRVIRNDDKMYFETAMPVNGEGSMRMAFLLRDNTCYYIIPGMRAYMKMPVEDMSEILDSSITEGFEADANATYISSSEVDYNGKKYICDVYESEGSTMKYYYNDKELKRMEATDPNGNITIMEFNEVSKKTDNSKFKVPSGYLDMTRLMGQSASAFAGNAPATTR